MTLRLVVFGWELGRIELTEHLENQDQNVWAARPPVANRLVNRISRSWCKRML
jgi:hypothetical protein